MAQTLTFTTCQAPIHEALCEAITRYVSERLGIPTKFVADIPWEERERLFDEGKLDVGWICGAPYVRKVDELHLSIELLAAPVLAAPRYGGRPIYFSDVVVRRDSPFQTFADLRGARWACNNHGSHSGYHVVRYHLAKHGLNGDLFGQVIVSGSHQRSIEMILDGEIDASAIDTTVLDAVCERDPAVCERLRVIDVMGPSPQPPWVIGQHVPQTLRKRLRALLTHMHEDPQGRAILARGQFTRFAAVNDRDYDDIREMLRIADEAKIIV